MPKAYDDETIYRITHQLRSSAEMRAALARKIASGLPLGASHVPKIRPGIYASGSISISPKEYNDGRKTNQ